MEQAAFQRRLEEDRELVEARLAGLFRNRGRYARLAEAMEYSLLAGGKRVRPVLTLEVCRMCGEEPELALPFACGVEMIHTYSLIHDDLPAMDDDDLRRGRPTSHRVFGEATAILAGDGLLTAAFQELAGARLPPERIVQGVACLSREAGPEGMVGGQALDMAGEGLSLNLEQLERLQSLKTGALIAAAAELGCIAAGGGAALRRAVRAYALALGRAFQVRDDILDVTGTDGELGKPVGSDRERGKSTFASVLGLEKSRALVEELTHQAVRALDGLEGTEFLAELARSLADRSR